MPRFTIVLFTLLSVTAGFAQPHEIWRWAYGGSGFERCAQLTRTSHGYLLAGSVSPTQNGPSQLYALEIDTTGDVIWAATYQAGTYDCAFAARELESGDFVLAGSTTGPTSRYLLRLDAAGNITDVHPVVAPTADYRDGNITADGGLVMSGGTTNHIAVNCAGSDGTLEWSRQYGNESYLCAWHAVETRNGDWIVPG